MENGQKRLFFLDILRAFAVFMMVQGHTIHATLATEAQISGSMFFSVWNFMRGFTAPMFMFTAGTVFTYLLGREKKQLIKNPRMVKGLKRAALLLLFGYVLRYPSDKLFDFANFNDEMWRSFFGFDALHLIGSGLLLILLLKAFSEYSGIKSGILFSVLTLIIFICNPIFQFTNWNIILPLPFASMLYNGIGSQFPLFPWIGYMTAGAYFGSKLSVENFQGSKNNFSKVVLTSGIFFIAFYYLIFSLEGIVSGSSNFITFYVGLSFFRLGFILVATGLIMIFSANLNSLPLVVRSLGKHSLLIYIVHLILVYGSAWVPGLTTIWGNSLSTFESISCAAVMVAAMTLFGWTIEKYKGIMQQTGKNISNTINQLRLQLQSK